MAASPFHTAERAAPTAPTARAIERRAAILARLAAGGGLWPLLPFNPCALCALPRPAPVREPVCGARPARGGGAVVRRLPAPAHVVRRSARRPAPGRAHRRRLVAPARAARVQG